MSQINSNTKDDFQVVFLLSCFVGHAVYNTRERGEKESRYIILERRGVGGKYVEKGERRGKSKVGGEGRGNKEGREGGRVL